MIDGRGTTERRWRRICRIEGAIASRRAVALVAVVLGASIAVGAPGAAASGRAARATPPFEVISEYPTAPGSSGVSAIQVRFSGLLAPGSARPSISPRVPGRWIVQRNVLLFRPAGSFPPGAVVTVTVPAGAGGVRSIAGRTLARRVEWRFGTSSGSVLRAEQVLAQLGYLPIHFVPAVRHLPSALDAEREVFVPPAGHFAWTWDAPTTLRAQWEPGRPSVMLTGALMAFATQQNLPATGVLDPQLWSALVAASQRPGAYLDRAGYTYALADKASPESLTVWHGGHKVLVSPANTGGASTPTVDGTFPVYERLATQVMRGLNPDGSPYADPVAWVAYFNGGDAIHYIARAA